MSPHTSASTEQELTRVVEQMKRELSDAQRREAATAQVLKAISRSTINPQEVPNSLIESAVKLTGAEQGLIIRQDGEVYRAAAIYGVSPEFIEVAKQNPIPQGRQSATGRAVLDRRIVHIHDVSDDPEYTGWAEEAGIRTILAVPMLRGEIVVGVIGCGRREVRPFTPKQIELVQTFADQAVIAIENTRLFEAEQASKRELQESLQFQTATSEVLSVISRSPDRLQPVLDVITETAVRLCRATYGHVRLLREDGAYHVAAHQIPDSELLQLMRDNPFRPGMDSVAGRVALQGVTVHVADVGSDPHISGLQRRISDKVRTAMGVPLKQGGRVVGISTVWHTQVRSFTEREIKLVETFADQAVIAINNVGLFEEVQARTRELTESLEQQTATADVLKVISRSTFDLQGVLDALVESASRLCGAADVSISRLEGDALLQAAHFGPILNPVGYVFPAVRGTVTGLCVLERRPVHVADLQAEKETYPEGSAIAREFGHRTTLAVPLLREGAPLGAMALRRAKVEPFTHKQIELVTTFADQAVIAIENARLFEEVQARTRELAESLEQQTSTSNVLSVISRSPGDLEPVFAVVLQNAVRICDAKFGTLSLYDGDAYQNVTLHNVPAGLAEAS